MTEQQKIISLLFSADPSNIELGLSIAKSLEYNDLMSTLLFFMDTKDSTINIENISKLRDTHHFYHLSNQNLESIPPLVGAFQSAYSFYLYSNHLTSLPDELANLPYLSTLYLQNNKFEQFPSNCLRLPQLKFLYLNSNKISEIPPEIGDCASLEALSLTNNRLRTLPLEILRLQGLRMIFLDGNPWDFDAMPAVFFDPQQSPKPICEALTRLRNDRQRKD